MRLILLGPPGAGKGTQAAAIVDVLGLKHISTGDMFRNIISKGGELGERIDSILNNGHLVPDDVTLETVETYLTETGLWEGFLMDGFPRTVNQAESLDEMLNKRDFTLNAVIAILVEDNIIVNRLLGRLGCPKCGAIYNLTALPPKVEGKCDKDGVSLSRRGDDTEEKIRERLGVYHKQTQPLIEYYEKNANLVTVDGNGHPDEVKARVMDALKNLAKS